MDILLDTVIFNRLADDLTSESKLLAHNLFATHVQFDELGRTVDPVRRQDLQSVFGELISEFTPTINAVWDESRWDQSSWGDQERYQRFLDELTRADSEAKKRHSDRSNRIRDTLIGLTALERQLALVTEDETLSATVKKFGGQALRMSDL